MLITSVILMVIVAVSVIYYGSKFLRDARAIRRELSGGKTLTELDEMIRDDRDQLIADFDEINQKLDKKIQKLQDLNREAEKTAGRLESLLSSERLKTLEERGILFAIEAGESAGKEKDRNTRIAELLRGGASVEEVARITEASVREVELVKLLIRRTREAGGG